MITIQMAGGFNQTASFGPAPFFELDRDALRQGPERVVIARHVRHAWVSGRSQFSSLEVQGPVLAIFTDTLKPQGVGRTLGPFMQLRVAGDFAYGDSQPLAEFAETIAQWCARPDPTCWPLIELRSA
jgi:hypothetical protein